MKKTFKVTAIILLISVIISCVAAAIYADFVFVCPMGGTHTRGWSENAIPNMWCPACGKQELVQDEFHCTKCGAYGRWFKCQSCDFLDEEWPEIAN